MYEFIIGLGKNKLHNKQVGAPMGRHEFGALEIHTQHDGIFVCTRELL